MRWLYRIFFLLSIIGLAVLAALPYLPKIEREVAHFCQTWKLIRERREVVDTLENPEPKADEAAIDRGRSLITPGPH